MGNLVRQIVIIDIIVIFGAEARGAKESPNYREEQQLSLRMAWRIAAQFTD